MFKMILFVLCIVLLVGVGVGGLHLYRVSERNKKEMAPYKNLSIAYDNQLGRTLVIYYSLTGHTEEIAKEIAQQTQGDLFRIETQEPIRRFPWFYLTLKKQLLTQDYPEIKGNVPDLSQYDTIFVGSPVWWYTISTPVCSFLKQVDFKGRSVVPFSTQGSNYGTFFDDFNNMAQNAHVHSGESFNNLGSAYDSAIRNKVIHWLNQIKK